MAHDLGEIVLQRLAGWTQHDSAQVAQAFRRHPLNIGIIIQRQFHPSNDDHAPIIRFQEGHEEEFCKNLVRISDLDSAIFHLARTYDQIWNTVFQNRTRARSGKLHEESMLEYVNVDLNKLSDGLDRDAQCIDWEIEPRYIRDPTWKGALVIEWKRPVDLDLSCLPVLPSLSSRLPGEERPMRCLAGIGTGGGSDVVTASLLGHTFSESSKEMNLLVSTRASRTGSQGKPGSGKIGSKREIYNHGGHAVDVKGTSVEGTFLITESTRSEGRDLERIPSADVKEVWIALDPGHGHGPFDHDNPSSQLRDRLYSIISSYERGCAPESSHIDTLMAVDTGGDVLGPLHGLISLSSSDSGQSSTFAKFSTPDQDARTVMALTSGLRSNVNLILAIVCPGIDSPDNLPQIAGHLSGVRYIPNSSERQKLILLLTDRYRMDGRDESRFGKSSLCLLAALKRRERMEIADSGSPTDACAGEWVSLPLPRHVIETRDNPWSSFARVTDAMAQIVFLPMKEVGDALRRSTSDAA